MKMETSPLSFAITGLSAKSSMSLRLSHLILLLPLCFVSACKPNAADGSKIKGLTDGGCAEYQRRLNALMTELKEVERVGIDGKTNYKDSTKESSVEAKDIAPVAYTVSVDPSSSPKYRELSSKIESARRDLSICMKNKAGQIDTVKIPGNGNAGHCDYNGQPYDILNYNCHSAANQSVSDNPFTTGIVSCRNFEPLNSPAHHTFNYRLENKVIVYYNWGQTCKAPYKKLPPDISDPDHQACARLFCGKQYGEDTIALPVGQKVEEPGPLYCSSTTSTRASCDSCCQYRGKFWDTKGGPYRPTDGTFSDFMSQCYTACAKKPAR